MNYKKLSIVVFVFAILTTNLFAQFGASNDILKVKAFKSLDKVTPKGEFKIALKVNIK